MSDSSGIIVVFMMFFMLIGAGAAYYFLIYKPSLIVNCVGAWSNTGTCTNSSLQTQTYTIKTSNAFGGTACSNATGDTKTITCTPATITYKDPSGFSLCIKNGTILADTPYKNLTTTLTTACEANCSSDTSCTAYQADDSNCLLYNTIQQVKLDATAGAKNKCYLKNT